LGLPRYLPMKQPPAQYDERRQVWVRRFEDQKNSGLSMQAGAKANA